MNNRVFVSRAQLDFLKHNTHLIPFAMISLEDVLVHDTGLINSYGEYTVFVLTEDCKVQSMETYCADMPGSTLDADENY